jgi:diguanylate cyclase (GGDEF)-like protein
MAYRLERTRFGLPYLLLIGVLGVGFLSLVWVSFLSSQFTPGKFLYQLNGINALGASVFLLLMMLCVFLRYRPEHENTIAAEDGLCLAVVLVFPTEISVSILGVAAMLNTMSQLVEQRQRGLEIGAWYTIILEVLYQGGSLAFIGLTGSTVEKFFYRQEWHPTGSFSLSEVLIIPAIYLSILLIRLGIAFLYLWSRGMALPTFVREVRGVDSLSDFLTELSTVLLCLSLAVVYQRMEILVFFALSGVLLAIVALVGKQIRSSDELQRTIAELKILNGVGRALSAAAQTRQELLKTLYQEGKELFGADSLAVYMLPGDEVIGEDKTLRLETTGLQRWTRPERRGKKPEFGTSGRWNLRSSSSHPSFNPDELDQPEENAIGLAEWCLRNRRPLRVDNIQRESRSYGYHWLTEQLPYRSWLGVPLEADRNPLGVISIASTEASAFTEQDEEMLRTLGQQVVSALENARLFELATIDGLTRLLNSRYLRQKLAEEFERTTKNRGQLSVVMVDIDHFKKINDTHGHEVGNEVLQHLAILLRGNLRDSDVAGRYGGEEFMLILPNTPAAAAHFVAERLRRTIEETPAETDSGLIQITASLGVANVPSSAVHEPDALIEMADRALYESKRAGRNRVTLANPLPEVERLGTLGTEE